MRGWHYSFFIRFCFGADCSNRRRSKDKLALFIGEAVEGENQLVDLGFERRDFRVLRVGEDGRAAVPPAMPSRQRRLCAWWLQCRHAGRMEMAGRRTLASFFVVWRSAHANLQIVVNDKIQLHFIQAVMFSKKGVDLVNDRFR